jgi:hypothetical protein
VPHNLRGSVLYGGLKGLSLKGGSPDTMMFVHIIEPALKDKGGDYYSEGEDKV